MFGKETEEIYTTENGNFVSLEGTSSSAAVVSGIAALLLQKHPDWTPSQVQAALKLTATTLGLDKNKQGAGIANIMAAMNADFTCLNIDFNIDPKNCGKCGNICTGTYKCLLGVCEFCGDNACNGDETYSTCNKDCTCTPICTNKVCGDDGCGGTCGTCTDGKTCSAGKCMFILKGIRVKCTNGICEDYVLDEINSACLGEYTQNNKIYKTGYSDANGELISTVDIGKFTI
jgi:hypothetical protein